MADRESTTRDRPEVEETVPARMLAPSEPEVVEPGSPGADEVEGESQRPPNRRRWRWILLLLVVAAVGVGVWRLLSPKAVQQRPVQQAQPVGAAKIVAGDINNTLTGLGTVTPLFTITVQTQINGQLMEVGFKEGQLVHKGDFLAQIDDRPYKAALALAQGSLAHDTGLLEQAQSDLARYETLSKQDSIALQQVADQKFLVAQDKGLVQQDQANIDTANLNIGYCRIVAPVTGRVGLRLIDPGNYVQTTNTTGLVVLAQVEPISVVFVLPEDDIGMIWEEVRQGKTLSVSAYDRTNDKLIATGTLASLDNLIDTTTGTLKLRADFPNADEALYPNQFVNARMVVRTLDNVTIAPVAAIQHGAPGDFVFLVKPDDSIAVQKVQTGVTNGDRIQIVSGLKAGDTVVVDGADRLREGMKVRISDQNTGAANTNNGPGAPPGEQPDNAKKVPPDSRVQPGQKDGAAQPTGGGAAKP